MSSCPPCLPPKGQLFDFPGTGGPLLLLGEALLCGPHYLCLPWCCPAPKIPQGTVVFFEPPKVPPPYRPPMPPVSPPFVPPVPPEPPVLVGNTPQTCSDVCPEGTTGPTIEITVDADTFFDEDQAVANAAAMASACAQVAVLRAASPCVSDFEPSLVETACRNREGTATLCGYSELTNADGPSCAPRKYRHLVGYVRNDWLYYGAFDCPNPAAGDPRWYESNGEWQYNAGTCVKTGSGLATSSSSPPVAVLDTAYLAFVPYDMNGEGQRVVTTRTTAILSLVESICWGSPVFPSEQVRYTASNGTVTLSDEDTEADAIARLVPTLPAWAGIAWVPCAELPCCESSWSNRTCLGGASDFDLLYQEGQVQVHAEGFTPGTNALVHAHIWRENLDTLVEELSEVQDYAVLADGSGEADFEFELPNEAGYRIYVKELFFEDNV